MTLKIENELIELKYSFRSAIYFEQITGHNIDFTNFTGNDLITLFYSVFIASLQKEKKPIIDMITFLDIVDENGGDKCIMEFSNWYIDIMNKQYEVLNSTEKEEQKETEIKNGKIVSGKKK